MSTIVGILLETEETPPISSEQGLEEGLQARRRERRVLTCYALAPPLMATTSRLRSNRASAIAFLGLARF